MGEYILTHAILSSWLAALLLSSLAPGAEAKTTRLSPEEPPPMIEKERQESRFDYPRRD